MSLSLWSPWNALAGGAGRAPVGELRADRHPHHRGSPGGERKAQLIAGVPVGRSGDVADLITSLRREESGWITGATYDVNGGSHLH